MAKRKVIRNTNRPFTYSPHYYTDGGDLGIFDFKNTFTKGNINTMLKSGIGSALGSTVGNIAGGAIAGGLKSGAGSAISNIGGTIGGAVGAVNPLLGGIISAGSGIIGGLTNRMFGSKLNEETIAGIESSNKAMNTLMVDSSSFDSVSNQWANQNFGEDFSKSDIGKDGWFSNKAKNKYKALQTQQNAARNRVLTSFENAAESADIQSDLNILGNFAAYGGPLDIWGYGGGAIGYELAKENLNIKEMDALNKSRITSLPNSFSSPKINTFAKGGGIHIKPENRGKFTEYCGEKVTSECIARGKRSSNSDVRKRATFADNARKWHHADGGPLGEENLSLEDFITQKINEKRAAALDKSRNRTEPVLPIINGIPNRNSCIYTATDNYGKKYRVPGNWTFYENPEKYGFIPVDINDAQAGDIIQVLDKGAPYHAMILDGYDEQGRPLYNYSRGSRGDSSDIVKSSTNFPNTEKLAYTFIGTPADSTQWINEYKEMYNKKADGGELFTNGVTIIGNGGTHESNPYEGVQMGIDPQGIPNLVEEGEVVFNDYVFSNRLIVPDAVREKYKLRGNKELTFADAAKQVQKESKERPNDPISKRGLESAMLRLQQEQEVVREEKQASQEGRQYAHGGKMGILYAGTGPYPNFLGEDEYDEDNFLGYTKRGILVDTGDIISFTSPDIVSAQSKSTTVPSKETGSSSNGNKRNLSWLRYAPVVGSAIGLGQNLLSKPDYSNADTILAAAEKAGTYTPVGFDPIGNYLQYNPLDRNFYINKLNAQAGATRRAIMNTSSPSRNAALLAADYNAQGRLGDLARQAEEYNLAQRQAVEQFNRATNMTNAEMGLKAAMANQEAALNAGRTRLSGTTQAMAMRDEIAARRGASMSANLTNLFDSLGNIGIDEMNRADRDMLIRAGVFGTLSEKPQGWSNKRWEDYKKTISGKGYSRGGQLKKKRGGFTY